MGYKKSGLFLSIPNKACYISLVNIYNQQPSVALQKQRRGPVWDSADTSFESSWQSLLVYLPLLPYLHKAKQKRWLKEGFFFYSPGKGNSCLCERGRNSLQQFCLLEVAICFWFRKCCLGGNSQLWSCISWDILRYMPIGVWWSTGKAVGEIDVEAEPLHE